MKCKESTPNNFYITHHDLTKVLIELPFNTYVLRTHSLLLVVSEDKLGKTESLTKCW